jgi:EAL domain-containing protein (putative c-di-GMP-specific phosphodiesterase class I)
LFCSQFFNTTLPEDIKKILLDTGLKPEHLRVELTERALLEKTDIVLTNMKALKQLGVKILLDDFGTGYSSLSYLHRFPIDVLKIDRSFITNVHEHENNKAIIKTIIDLAANLNMATVGEGIENNEDALLLHQMDCLYGQGYYYAKPMPADKMEQYIIANSRNSPNNSSN